MSKHSGCSVLLLICHSFTATLLFLYKKCTKLLLLPLVAEVNTYTDLDTIS